jgi:hypothetical protein
MQLGEHREGRVANTSPKWTPIGAIAGVEIDGRPGGVKLPGSGELTFDAFVAVADLVNCVATNRLPADLKDHQFAVGPWGWILTVEPRIGPIACPVAQPLWTSSGHIGLRMQGV